MLMVRPCPRIKQFCPSITVLRASVGLFQVSVILLGTIFHDQRSCLPIKSVFYFSFYAVQRQTFERFVFSRVILFWRPCVVKERVSSDDASKMSHFSLSIQR